MPSGNEGTSRYGDTCRAYLSPAAGLPLGAAPPSASPLLAGAWQVLAVLLRDWPSGSTDARHVPVLVSPSTGDGALREKRDKII